MEVKNFGKSKVPQLVLLIVEIDLFLSIESFMLDIRQAIVLGVMNREEFFSFCFLAVCSTRVPNINLLLNIFMDDEGGPESALFLGSGGGSLIYLFYPASPLP